MAFKSDAAALSALCTLIFRRKYAISVMSGGDRLCAPTSTFLTVSVACHATTDDCILLIIDGSGKRCGYFRILMQDDPDCLIVDFGENVLTNSIFDEWFALAEAPASDPTVSPRWEAPPV